MKQTKITLANVLLILAAIAFGFAIYLGANYRTLGDTKQSLVNAVIATVVLGGLAFLAQKFKKAHRKFKTNLVLEALALLFFIVAAWFAIKPFSHVFTVFKHKASIEESVMANISQAQSMFQKYESDALKRENTYESTLNAVVAAKKNRPDDYKSYGFNETQPSSDDSQFNTKTFILHAQLFPSDYDTTKVDAINWLADVNDNVKNDFGFMFGIVNIINAVPPKIDGWRTQLIEFSNFKPPGDTINNVFSFDLDFKTVTSQLTNEESPTVLSIVLAILAYLLMLLPYFLAERSTRYPGLKIIFGGRDIYDNEL